MPTFSQIWPQHPNQKGDAPLLDKTTYSNQCAINVYAGLQRSGVNVNTFHGQLTWQKDKPKYAIRAQELANWLASSANPLQSKVEKYSGKDIFDKIKGRTGVVFFQNYWGPGNQGDHIDFWNGFRLTHYRSIAQIYLRIGSFGLGSDYRGTESAWFWPVP